MWGRDRLPLTGKRIQYKMERAGAWWPWKFAGKEKVGLVVVDNERGGGVEIGKGGDVRGRQ